MRRLHTLIAASGAAALTALAVTVSAPAVGNSGGGDAEADAFVRCIHARLDGAPSGGMALKMWLGERLDRGDETVENAMNSCAPPKPAVVKRERSSPTEAQLRSCLEQHGARIEGDDRNAIKGWVASHVDDPAAQAAMKACQLTLPDSKPAPHACDDKDAAEPAAGTPAIAEN